MPAIKKIVEPDSAGKKIHTAYFEDDFFTLDDTRWVNVIGNTTMEVTGHTGVRTLTPGTTLDAMASIETALGRVELSATASLLIEGRFAVNEATLNDSQVLFGVTSVGIGNALLNGNGGPPANYEGVVFYKAATTPEWYAEVSRGTTQQTKRLAVPSVDNQFFAFRILIEAKNTKKLCTFWIDPLGGQALRTHGEFNANPRTPYVDLEIADATVRQVMVYAGIKNNVATAQQLLRLDYINVYQDRQ